MNILSMLEIINCRQSYSVQHEQHDTTFFDRWGHTMLRIVWCWCGQRIRPIAQKCIDMCAQRCNIRILCKIIEYILYWINLRWDAWDCSIQFRYDSQLDGLIGDNAIFNLFRRKHNESWCISSWTAIMTGSQTFSQFRNRVHIFRVFIHPSVLLMDTFSTQVS